MNSKPRISVFFPCYNDEMTIVGLVEDASAALERLGCDHEVIVVNDGSRDGSLGVLLDLQTRMTRLRVVNHEINRGYGAALISGIESAENDWIFYTDGDGQYDASEIDRLVELVSDDIDVVQGFKIGRGDPWYRKVIGRTYHHVVKTLFRLPIRDTDCDFRLFRRSSIGDAPLQSTSGVICVELVHRLTKNGARFVEVGVSHHHRPHGKSQFFRIPTISRAAVQLLSLWWRLTVKERNPSQS